MSNYAHSLDFDDFEDTENSVISFLRRSESREDYLIFVCNFTPVTRYNYRVGVPSAGFYKELLNTESIYYGGTNIGNLGGVNSDDIPWHKRSYSINLTFPPLGVVIYKPLKEVP